MKQRAWIYKVFLLTFILSIIFSAATNLLSSTSNIIVMIIIMLLVISIGITFDMIGTSVLTVKESVFHGMSSQKVKGAKEALELIKKKEQVANLCNDVIGDICGIVSGGLGAVLAINLSSVLNINLTIISIIIAAFISSLTVGGKAIFKGVAVNKCDKIVFFVGKIKSNI